MKKLLTGVVVMTLVILVGGTVAFATGSARGRNFIDINGDGVCDDCNNFCQFVDADGDGICDNYGIGRCGIGVGHGTGYVDADGDGICDNSTAGTTKNGTGFQRGCFGGKGRCNR